MDQRLISFLLREKSTMQPMVRRSLPRVRTRTIFLTRKAISAISTPILAARSLRAKKPYGKTDIPVWSMNYCGRVISDGFNGDFLKRALLLVPKDAPYRGPEHYAEDSMAFHCLADGDPEWFQGYEEITVDQQRVYECFYHGGIIR
ncbi:MAG: DUF5680 domain-containing protein [Eubacteriales bacterium]